MRETFERSLDYLIETFDKMNSETIKYFGKEKNYGELSLVDFENLKDEYNLEMKFERDNKILQHSFKLVYENGGFCLDPSFDHWWKEISTIIKVNIYEKISMKNFSKQFFNSIFYFISNKV